MGLTIHYTIRTRKTSAETALRRVEAMRQLALDIPFDRVDDAVTHLTPEECAGGYERYRGTDDEMFGLLLSATTYVDTDAGKSSYPADPEELIGFFVNPASGAETAFIGLARYPETIRRPEPRGGWRSRPANMILKVRRPGWQVRTFSKTQYASHPSFGGIASFLRAHIGLITLLERIGEIPGVEIVIDDEGKYGPSIHSTDWANALREGREPIYEKHPGRYDPMALAEEVGRWNEHVAAVVGAFSDSFNPGDENTLEAPILDHPEFERLEFRGQQAARAEGVDGLLQVLSALGRRERESEE